MRWQASCYWTARKCRNGQSHDAQHRICSEEQMKIKPATSHSARIIQLAFTLPEVIVGVAIVVVMFVTLYGGMTSGFAITQLARENLRGTQIMLERVEGIRLYNWNQLVYSNMIPTTFTNYYYPLASNGQSQGIPYYGTMSISNTTLNPSASYS